MKIAKILIILELIHTQRCMYNIYLLYEVTANLENDICALLIFYCVMSKWLMLKKNWFLLKSLILFPN